MSRSLQFLFATLAGTLLAQNPPKPATPGFCENLGRGVEKFDRVASADPWFDVFRLDPQTFAIFEPRQTEHVLSYLLVGEKRALLFDSGFGIGRIDQVVKALTPLPVTVLNSHTHYDHDGGNFAFTDIIAVDSEYTRNHARGTPNQIVSYNVSPGYVCEPLPAGISVETYSTRAYPISRTIHDGEKFDLGGRELEFLLTPGHTPDAVTVLDRSHHQMLTGDTFYPGNLWLFVPETDLAAYQRSIERLARLAPSFDVLRPAHGRPEADPKLLAAVLKGLAEVKAGTAKFDSRNDRRTGEARRFYRFEGFSMLTQDPPKF